MQLSYAAALLEGPAQAWWMTLKQNGVMVPNSWLGFKEILTKRFQPVNSKRAARDRLLTLRQVDTVSKYAATFQQLLLKCPDIGPEDQVHRFIHGLKATISSNISLQKTEDLETAISMAETIDNAIHRHSSRPNIGHGSSTPMDLGAVQEEGGTTDPEGVEETGDALRLKKVELQLAALLQGKPSGFSSGQPRQGNSFRPSGTGGRQRLNPQEYKERKDDCSRNNLCFRCLRPGHIIKDCRSTWCPKANAQPV